MMTVKGLVCIFAAVILLGFSFPVDAQSIVDYPVTAFTISHDGTLMAVAGRVIGGQNTLDHNEYPIDLIDLSTGQVSKTIQEVWPLPVTLSLSRDNTLLAFGSVAGSAKIMDVASGQELYDFFGLSGMEPIGPAWSPVNNDIAVGLLNTITIINGSTLQPVTQIAAPEDAIFAALAWSSDGTQMATSTVDKHIQIWDTSSGNATLMSSLAGGGGSSMVWSPNGSFVAVGARGSVQFVDALAGTMTGSFPLESEISNALQVAWSRNGRFVAIGSEGRAIIFDAMASTSKLYNVNDNVNFVAWDKNDHLYYDAGKDGVCRDNSSYPQDPMDDPLPPSPVSPTCDVAA